MAWVPPSASSGLEGSLPTRLAWACTVSGLALLLCWFSPLSLFAVVAGTVAIVHAARVDPRLKIGMVGAATQSSQQAKKWSTIATILLALGALFVIGFARAGGLEGYRLQLELLQSQLATLRGHG